MNTLIGIAGNAGSGKDTVGGILEKLQFTRVAYAGSLKEIALLMGWDGEKDERGRTLLQEIGAAAVRYDPFIWVEKALPKFEEKTVITDVRHHIEVDDILSRGGFVFLLKREDAATLTEEQMNHASEREVREMESKYRSCPRFRVVHNNGTLKDLEYYFLLAGRLATELSLATLRPEEVEMDAFDLIAELQPGLKKPRIVTTCGHDSIHLTWNTDRNLYMVILSTEPAGRIFTVYKMKTGQEVESGKASTEWIRDTLPSLVGR